MSNEYLQWKYRDTETFGLAAKKGSNLIAFFGGMPREVLFQGNPITLVQIGDLMVHPTERGILRKKGPFWRVANEYLQTQVGKNNLYRQAFGFPSVRAYRLGELLGLYTAVDSIEELSWKIKTKYTPKLYLWRIRDWKKTDISSISKLWNDMRLSLNTSILGVRDMTWLKERFLDHPDQPYHIQVICPFWSQKPIGILIFRNRGNNVLEWIDMIGSTKHIKIYTRLACAYAFKNAHTRLFTWITKSHVHYFKTGNPIAKCEGINILMKNIKDDPLIEAAKNKWFLMSGDTDYR